LGWVFFSKGVSLKRKRMELCLQMGKEKSRCGKDSGQEKKEVEKEKGGMRSAPSGVAFIYLA